VITRNTGALCYDADFYPYGGERPYTDYCPQPYKFEGKERDAETGNDNFGARYYSNRYGRWLSADWSATPVAVPYATLANPQTLNLYAMVADDPETSADLDGHCGQGKPIYIPCGPDNPAPCTKDCQNGGTPKQGAAAAPTMMAACAASGACEAAAGTVAVGAGTAALALPPLTAMVLVTTLPPIPEQNDIMLDALTPTYQPAPPLPASPPPSNSQQGMIDTSETQTSRGPNVVADPNAQGPHTVPKRDPVTGKVTGYTEYNENGQAVRRMRKYGKTHGGVSPPLVLEPAAGKGPGSPPRRARPATPQETPK
jgi:RHS repeat-associated protein